MGSYQLDGGREDGQLSYSTDNNCHMVRLSSCGGTAVDVAQQEIGRTARVNRGDAGVLPLQTNRSDEGDAGQLIVAYVVDYQPPGINVAQQEIGFAGNAAKITDA
jgi:hypothetical protein